MSPAPLRTVRRSPGAASAKVSLAALTSRSEALSSLPRPVNESAATSSSRDTAPSRLAPRGPSASASLVVLATMSSSSTGTAVRLSGIVAPAARRGPPS